MPLFGNIGHKYRSLKRRTNGPRQIKGNGSDNNESKSQFPQLRKTGGTTPENRSRLRRSGSGIGSVRFPTPEFSGDPIPVSNAPAGEVRRQTCLDLTRSGGMH
jgi:hypothetical protein